MKHVASETFGVDTHQRRLAGQHIAHSQNYRLFNAIRGMPRESKDSKRAVFGREIGFGYLF
jgi:hypothetical protein